MSYPKTYSIFLIVNTMNGGGAERVVSELERKLSWLNCRVVTREDSKSAYPLNQEPISLYTNKPDIKSKYIHFLWINTIGLWKSVCDYKRLILQNNISLSISILDYSNITSVIACKLAKIPSIISVHSNPDNKSGWSIYSYYARKIGILLGKHFSENIVTVSHSIKDVLINSYHINPDKITVIYNPISLDTIDSLSTEKPTEVFFETESPIIISVGNIKPVKGQWHLIRVFAELRKEMPIKLVICGDGNLKPYLEKLVDDYNIKDDVLFTGWTANPYKYLSHADVFVSTSLSEALPTVHIEAMEVGCPVISTDCKHGPREILENGKHGLLTMELDEYMYTSSDPLTEAEMDLVSKLRMMLTDDVMRNNFIDSGKLRAKDFDEKIAIEKYEQLICSIIK